MQDSCRDLIFVAGGVALCSSDSSACERRVIGQEILIRRAQLPKTLKSPDRDPSPLDTGRSAANARRARDRRRRLTYKGWLNYQIWARPNHRVPEIERQGDGNQACIIACVRSVGSPCRRAAFFDGVVCLHRCLSLLLARPLRGCDRINWTKGREFSTLCWMPRRGLSADEKRWLKVLSTLNEAQQRWYVADKALDLGWGGISRRSTVTGLSRTTITKAIAEITGRRRLGAGTRVRQAGGGRNAIKDIDAGLLRELQSILEETTAGDPMSLLQWTTTSTRGLAEALTRRGHPVSGRTVARRLHDLGVCAAETVRQL